MLHIKRKNAPHLSVAFREEIQIQGKNCLESCLFEKRDSKAFNLQYSPFDMNFGHFKIVCLILYIPRTAEGFEQCSQNEGRVEYLPLESKQSN